MCFLFAASCSGNDVGRTLDPDKKLDVIDKQLGLDRQDFRDLNNSSAYIDPSPKINANVLEPAIPELTEILAAPRPPKIAQAQLVSIAVTDDVPLKDVLVELARLADVDIEVDPAITGGIIFRAKDRPFNEVIDRIADLAGLRYRVQNNVLRVERDIPYIQTYALDMLNKRPASAQIPVSSGGSSSGSGGSSSGGSSGGTSSAATSSASGSTTDNSREEFWKKFEDGIKQIVAFRPRSMVSVTDVAAQPTPAGVTPAATADPAAPAPVVAAPVMPSATGNTSLEGAGYTINRQAGTLTVSATDRQHDIIRQFIQAVDRNVSSQVLIEAKIVEVSLNERYQTGINWRKLSSRAFSFSADFSDVSSPSTTLGSATVGVIKNDFLGGMDLDAAVSLLDQFGTTRALSSPRISAMNNQQALLSFVENLIYFDVECEVTDATPAVVGGSVGTPAKVEVTTEKREQPLGIILTINPSINKETQEVTLGIRPTLTRLVKTVSDPGFELCKASALSQAGISSQVINTLLSIQSTYPQVETRELDSSMKIRSGQVMVIGGLLEDRVANTDTGMPGLSEVPYFGNFFKAVDKNNQKKELVILIRATIVDSQGYMDAADKNVYEKFMQDPRPIIFPEP
ncbi:MAG: hypothetical protein SFW63_06930 [Alphaproteobacteria bacterium]|nr:hypothetical protein [Alphaproteobacteria bacterium]